MRYVTIGILVCVAAASWGYSIYELQTSKREIILQLADWTQALALPLRVAEMAMQERDWELPVPVHGVQLEDIADSWGASRSGGREHEGVDIFAERGTPVYSATDGYVVRVGNGELGGNFVFVVGPGGVRYYYAHLNTVARGIGAGTRVTPDTVVGFVGNTGNAETTPPHLHFSVYVRGPENPYPLLVDRE